MIDRFEKDFARQPPVNLRQRIRGFCRWTILLLNHPNRRNKILQHGRLSVSLMVLLTACLWGHEPEGNQLLAGHVVTRDLIEDEIVRDPTRIQARRSTDAPSLTLNLPPRPATAETGSALIETFKQTRS